MSQQHKVIFDKPLRVLVCGTTFGRVYMEAVRRTHPRMVLAGVLARGSDQSQHCATAFGVPLYTSVSDLPEDIDIACVVVRSGVVGGAGAQLANQLIARGIHVMQEQPANEAEVANCLREAHKAGVHYQLNPFYRSIAPVRELLTATHRLRSYAPIDYVEATCAVQVLYPMLDLLGKALGGLRPWSFGAVASHPTRNNTLKKPFPYSTIEASISGTPVTLRVQNELDPTDPDNYAYCLLRATLGTERGNLTLSDTLGPLLWHPRLHVPKGADGAHALDPECAPHLELPSFSLVSNLDLASHSAGNSFRHAFSHSWPEGVAYSLQRFADVIEGKTDATSENQYSLGVCGLWQDLAQHIGDPRFVEHRTAPQPLGVTALLDEVAASPNAAALNSTATDNTNAAASNWLRCYNKIPNPRIRLFCLPHAGGSASLFREWGNLVPDHVEVNIVQYPGREERLEEPLITTMDALVDGIVRALVPLCDRPFALFGHSMGASVAYEVAGRLAALGMPAPAHLFVSGQWAPVDHQNGDLYLQSDAALCAELVRVGGAGPWLEEPELRALMLPMVRSDFQLIETYQPGSWKLNCPVTAYAGIEDPDVDAQTLQGWAQVTNRPFTAKLFAGDHFYLIESRNDLISDLGTRLLQQPAQQFTQEHKPTSTTPDDLNENNNPSDREVDMADPYAQSAEFYDIMAAAQWQTAGPLVTEALATATPSAGPILEVGAGTGLSTQVIADAVPDADIIAVEPSAAMRSALTSRLLAKPELAQRVTVESACIAELELPEKLCACVVVGVVGYIEPNDRTALWNGLAQRLPQGAPLIVDVMALPKPMKVPPMNIAKASIGNNEYRIFIRGEPADNEGAQRWTMNYEILKQGRQVRAFETQHIWQTFSIDDVIDEIMPAGFEGFKITPHMAVLTRI